MLGAGQFWVLICRMWNGWRNEYMKDIYMYCGINTKWKEWSLFVSSSLYRSRNVFHKLITSDKKKTRKPIGHFNRPFWPSPPLGFTNVSAILYLYEPAWRKVWLCDTILTITLLDDVMFKLWWLSLSSYRFYLCWKTKFTQTLNVDINSSTTENAHTGTTKHLLLCLDLKYKQWT